MVNGSVTRSSGEKSALARSWEPARRFIRAQDVMYTPDTVLDPEELEMRRLLNNANLPNLYTPCTDQRIIDVYDLFLFAPQRDLILCLLIVGNTVTETAIKTGLSIQQVEMFIYFFCNNEFLALPPASKTAVLSNPSGFHRSSELMFAINTNKEIVDFHFNIRVNDLKVLAVPMLEHTICALNYLGNKEAHYVKPHQKSFKPVIETLIAAKDALREYSGGEKSGTVDQVMKDISDLKGKRTQIEVKNPEDLNLPPIEEDDSAEPEGGN